jgi:hypothetical protein
MLNTKEDFKQIEMDTIQQEQLFTDVTPEQAETISAAALTGSYADAPFGRASATLSRSGPKSFNVRYLSVFDEKANGYAVYAKFQAQAGNTILTTPTKRFDRKGEAGDGTTYNNLTGAFSKNISAVRVVIYQEDPGNDSVAYGNWTSI